MSKRRSQKPTKASPAQDAPKAFHVSCTGARQEVRYSRHTTEEATPTPPIQITSASDLQERELLEQLVTQEFERDERDVSANIPLSAEGQVNDRFRDELEAQLEDSAETFAKPKAPGEGQNQMLGEWMRKFADPFLGELYREYASPEHAACLCGVSDGERFRCNDCLTDVRYCLDCLKATHTYLPHHRISKWTGQTWSRTSLAACGVSLKLCSHPLPCVRTAPTPLLLGDVNGFFNISVTYCECSGHPDRYLQLLRSSIMPCSTQNPISGFTFRSLRLYDLLSADAKLSCSRYHAVIQRQSNNIEPNLHQPRLRELLRVTRQWSYLQQLKWSGQRSTATPSLGAMTIRCPACPRLDVNYTADDVTSEHSYLYAQQLSYDGSFQLVRKNKSTDEFDICLTDGLSYWVQQASYLKHLQINSDTKYAQSTHNDDTCNNHHAANDTWVHRSGVAETGVGAVTCARHMFFMPQGCVNYWKGERFAYTDYAIASVMANLSDEGADQIGIFYDIFCHWSRNFWSRAPMIVVHGGELQRPARFFGGVPKYHLAGHVDSCYAQYLLNNMHGAGRLDAEGCECAWANINGASGSTSEKGPGSRIDALNHCMNDWNWRKMVTMISYLLKKLVEAVKIGDEQEESWLYFHGTIDTALTDKWAMMSTKPYKVKNKWTSVFLLDQSKCKSRLKTVLDLNTQESARIIDSDSTEPGFTAPSWISEGIDIEKLQCKLCGDVEELGEGMTDRQALDIYNRCVSLTTRISTHHQNTALFLDIRLDDMGSAQSLAQETEGQPERALLYLPSHLGKKLLTTDRSNHVTELEKIIWRSECLETLRRVRTACLQKSQMLIGKGKNACGEVLNTRAQNTIGRLSKRIDNAREEYNISYTSLRKLGLELKDLKPLQPLLDSQFNGLMTILRGDRELGEKQRRLPWFWTVRGDGEEMEPIVRSEEDTDAIRVEWFHGRERYRHWREEELWLRREIASTLFSYRSLRDTWKERCKSEYAQQHQGYRSYCIRQSDVFHGLLESGFRRSLTALREGSELGICRRALDELSSEFA